MEYVYYLGLMQILDQEKDEIIGKLESDMKTLETKNLELKYANRNLISTVSEQKNMLKALKLKIKELESLKKSASPNNFEELKKEYQKLLENNKNLKLKLEQSQQEIAELKKLKESDAKSSQSLFGRFLNRNNNKSDENVEDKDEESDSNRKV